MLSLLPSHSAALPSITGWRAIFQTDTQSKEIVQRLFIHASLLRGLLPLEIGHGQILAEARIQLTGLQPSRKKQITQAAFAPSAIKREVTSGEQRLYFRNTICLSTSRHVWETNSQDSRHPLTPQSGGNREDTKGVHGAGLLGHSLLLGMPRDISMRIKPASKPSVVPWHKGSQAQSGGLCSGKAHKAPAHTTGCTARAERSHHGLCCCQHTRAHL